MPYISVLKPEHTGTQVKYRNPTDQFLPVTILEKDGYPGMRIDWLDNDQVALVEFESGTVQIVHCTNLCTN